MPVLRSETEFLFFQKKKTILVTPTATEQWCIGFALSLRAYETKSKKNFKIIAELKRAFVV
jgi:hypothetical protein